MVAILNFKIAFLARLFKEHGNLLQYPRRESQRENEKVFGASNVYTRVLIFGMDVLLGTSIGVVESK